MKIHVFHPESEFATLDEEATTIRLWYVDDDGIPTCLAGSAEEAAEDEPEAAEPLDRMPRTPEEAPTVPANGAQA